MRCLNVIIIFQTVLGVVIFLQRETRCDGRPSLSIDESFQTDLTGKLDISGNLSWSNIHLRSLSINSLKHLVLRRVNLIWDGMKPIFLKHLQDIRLYECKVNPHSLLFSNNLNIFKISGTEIINGTLYDLLKTGNNIQNLSVAHMGETDLSELLSNHYMNQRSFTFFTNLVELELWSTKLKNTRIAEILNVCINLKKVVMDNISGIDVSRINPNYTNYLSGTHIYFGKELVHFALRNTTLVNGNLVSIFKVTKKLEQLFLDGMGNIDISAIPHSRLKHLDLWNCNLKSTRKIRFEKLTHIVTHKSSMTDMKPLLEFNEWFPRVLMISTSSRMIVPPKAILAMIKSSLTLMTFSFDCNPPIKSYEFGKVMKFMLHAGFQHIDDRSTLKEKAKKHLGRSLKEDITVGTWKQRIHEVHLQRQVFLNGSFKWILKGDYTIYELSEIPELDIKSTQTKALIYIYFILVSTLLFFGITGNFLSAFVLLIKKPKNSAVIILLGLTFFDFIVITTYLITAILNAELFYGMFLKTGVKSTRYTVEQHLWMSQQNAFHAFLIYPLNKTAYTGSVYTTILISLERFIAICWPLKSKQLLRSRNSKLAIVTISVFSILLNIPRWIESYEWNYYSDDSPDWNDYYKPALMRIETYRIFYHGWVWTCFMYILPFVLVGFFNFKLLTHLKHSRQKRKSLQSTGSNTAEKETKEGAEISSLTKMLLCVVAVFVLCNSLHIVIVLYFFVNYDEIQLSTIEAVSCLPIIVNCSVNFIIYIYFGKTLRADFLRLIPRSCLSCCKKGQSTNTELSATGQHDTR